MKIVHILAFLFLAVWLIITGFAGLAGYVIPHFLIVTLNFLALASGILFLAGLLVCPHHCHCDKCCAKDVNYNRDKDIETKR
jgi:hypothetical protein